MPCSVGFGDELVCSDDRLSQKDLGKDDWQLLKIRSACEVLTFVCTNHKKKYLDFFTARHPKCCNPLGFHNPKSTGPGPSGFPNGVKIITLQMHYESEYCPDFGRPLIPGLMLCKRCSTDVRKLLENVVIEEDKSKKQTSTESTPSSSQDVDYVSKMIEEAGSVRNVIMGPEIPSTSKESEQSLADRTHYAPEDVYNIIVGQVPEGGGGGCLPQTHSQAASADEDVDLSKTLSDLGSTKSDPSYVPNPQIKARDTINKSLAPLGIPQIEKNQLSSAQCAAKIKEINERYLTLFHNAGFIVPNIDSYKFKYEKVLEALKRKFSVCDNLKDKLGVLSIALCSMTIRDTLSEFSPLGATEYMIRKTSTLVTEQGILPNPQPRKGHSLPAETVKLIQDFYEEDDISSRQMPGKKDYVSVKVGNTRVHMQKRLVLCNLKELHRAFKEKYPSIKVSFSKFASLRPKHCVLASASGTHSVCVCKHHQNFKLLLEAANFKQFDSSLSTYYDYINAVICDPPTPDCYINSCCPKCPGTEALKSKLRGILTDNFIDTVTFNQWTDTDRCSLDTKTKDYEEFLDMFIDQLEKLLPHHFISKEQSKYFKKRKEDLKEGEVLTMCDFAENYTCIVQDSIQNYYWQNDQVTIHPFVSYYKENGELKSISSAVISDHMKHDISAVFAFQKKHIEFLKEHISPFHKVIYFSDGAAQQYKNRFNVLNISFHLQDFGVDAEWNFFGTSHGKGPCDGQAGALKRSAYLASIRQTLIRNPREFFEWAKKEIKNIHVQFVSSEEVQHTEELLKKRFIEALKIFKMRSQHSVLPLGPGEVETKIFSYAKSGQFAPTMLIRKQPSLTDLNPGQLASFLYNEKWKIGEVILVDHESEEILMSLLEATRGNNFVHANEEISVPLTEILTAVQPEPAGAGFLLSSNDIAKIKWQLKSSQALHRSPVTATNVTVTQQTEVTTENQDRGASEVSTSATGRKKRKEYTPHKEPANNPQGKKQKSRKHQ